ncbi:MAG: hypothetical protein F6K00_21820 [Leptolyngbya sp. SIOISBB]|nr:hypothetical protein [Leptolyngbya sp. SIOISBB]
MKKFAAGVLLLLGITLSLALIADILDPETDRPGDSVAALVLFGLPPIALSGLLIHSLRQQHQANEQKSDREVEQLFLAEIQANDGVVSPIIFATKADLSIEDAKTYLDEKAVQLNGLYEATESGGITYRFPI